MKQFRLDDKKLKHPFRTPDDYFDHLEASILDHTVKSGKQESKIVTLTTRKVIYYLAAAVVLLALIAYPVGQFLNREDSYELLADISDDDILYYIDYYDIQEMEVLEFVGDDIEFDTHSTAIPDGIELDDENLEMLYLEYGINEI